MANLSELGAAFQVLAPVFRGSVHSLICGSSALAWLLAEFDIAVPVGDIDAVALTDDEFEQLVGRLGDLDRAGQFRFETKCGGWEMLPGEPVRRAAGRLLPHGIAFELFDRRSRFMGSDVIGEATTGAGIIRLSVGAGFELPFADVVTLRRVNDHALREIQGRTGGSVLGISTKLDKRRRWEALLDLLATEEGRLALGERSNTGLL